MCLPTFWIKMYCLHLQGRWAIPVKCWQISTRQHSITSQKTSSLNLLNGMTHPSVQNINHILAGIGILNYPVKLHSNSDSNSRMILLVPIKLTYGQLGREHMLLQYSFLNKSINLIVGFYTLFSKVHEPLTCYKWLVRKIMHEPVISPINNDPLS